MAELAPAKRVSVKWPSGKMRHHAERIRRIQELCAQLDHIIQDSHAVQETVEQLQAESGRLLEDLRPKPSESPARKSTKVRRR